MIGLVDGVVFIASYFGVLASAPIIIALGIAIYRVSFHPLARYPGPFIAKISDAYAGYHGWIGDVHLDAQRLHKRYGTFVRYGPNRLLINSANGFKDIYGHAKNVQKSKTYLPMVPNRDAWSTLTTIDKAHHRFKRRLISSHLGTQTLEHFEPIMQHYIEKFCTKLSELNDTKDGSGVRNMTEWCEFLTLDIIGSFAFGEKLGMLDSKANHLIMKPLHQYSWTMGLYEQIPSLSKLKLDRIFSGLTAWTKSQRAWKSWTRDFAARALNPVPGREKGIFSHIVEARNGEGNQLKFEELWAEGSFLLLAGFDTSATTLAALFFYLAKCPIAYARLEDEVQQTFSKPSEICTGDKLTSCIYLHACITEAMRMSPSTPGIPLREVLSPGMVIDGEYIRPGIDVGSCIYALHHHAGHFEDPDTFIPERWIRKGNEDSVDEEQRLATQYEVYSPFSIGPRSCPGRHFAMMEISLVLARVFLTLKFQFAGNETGGRHAVQAKALGVTGDEFPLRTHVTASSDGPYLTFEKRA